MPIWIFPMTSTRKLENLSLNKSGNGFLFYIIVCPKFLPLCGKSKKVCQSPLENLLSSGLLHTFHSSHIVTNASDVLLRKSVNLFKKIIDIFLQIYYSSNSVLMRFIRCRPRIHIR